MSRSFQNFMTAYCQELTGLRTTSLKKMFNAATDASPRACEPLLLLALSQDRVDYLLKLSKGTVQHQMYRDFMAKVEKNEGSLEKALEKLPDKDRFKRPYVAWQAEQGALAADRELLCRVSKAIEKVLNEKGISRAEACRRTGVNKGNFYALLKGDTTKMARKTAIWIYDQLVAL